MVRTRADNTARKAVAAKAPRKVLGSSSAGSSAAAAGLASPAGKYAGGNPYCPRPTPDWQKGMSHFLVKKPKESDKENDEPEDVDMEQSGSSASATTKSPVKDSAEGSSSASASSSSTSDTKTKKNGLIDSDSDEE